METLLQEIDAINMDTWRNMLKADYYPTSVQIKSEILRHREAINSEETPEHLIPLHKAEMERLQSILYPPQTLAS